MIYERCKDYNIPYRKCGKLVVAREAQQPYIESLHRKSLDLAWPPHSTRAQGQRVLPTTLLSRRAARELEPDLSEDIVAALWCPETGILDSHSFMQSLEKDVTDSEGGDLVYSTRVVRIDPYERSSKAAGVPDVEAAEDGWVVQTVTGSEDAEEGDAMLARTLINAGGLSSALILNSILPESARLPMYYARGSYASYNGIGIKNVSHLIYPCPELGGNEHAFHSLGTHLTIDLQGKVRFGPDIEWIEPPSENDCDDADFWAHHLTPDESRLPEMHEAVTRYLPGVRLEGMQPDYCGMRPKLVPPHGGFQDFYLPH
ncbi:FAD dependent oxidoreductase [Lyophyllum atratum]|nr:FAD dependent oxidoreductase [Lyophyllum atratum]